MSRWVPVIVIADLVFLPMFHYQGVPFKIGYLILLVDFSRHVPTRGLQLRFLLLFLALGTLTLVGWGISFAISGNDSFVLTFTAISIYIFAPIAFVFGHRHMAYGLRYIPHLIIAYFIVNILAIMFWSTLLNSIVGELYFYTEDFLGPGNVLLRAGGLHQNPHISALFMTMLMLLLFVAIKYRRVDIRSPLASAAILSGIALPFILGSRSELIATAFIVLALAAVLARTNRLSSLIVPVVAGAVLILTSFWVANSITRVRWDPGARLAGNMTRFFENPLNRESGLGRFLPSPGGLIIMTERLSISPIVGTGAEGASYHNDWFTVLVSAGIIGLLVYILLVRSIVGIEFVFLIPFIMAGMTNGFLLAAQHFTVFMIAAGVAWRLKQELGHRQIATNLAEALGPAAISSGPVPDLARRIRNLP